MSRGLDVLSVIDCAAETFVRMKGSAANAQLVNCQRDALVNARAAVAELIEAASAVAFVQINRRSPSNDMAKAKQVRLRAALARARGNE